MPFEYIIGTGDAQEKRIYFVYFFSSIILGAFVYFRSNRKEGFLKYFLNPKIWISRSAIIDYSYIFFNSLVKVFVLSLIVRLDDYLSFYLVDYLNSWFGYSTLNVNVVVFAFIFLLCLTVIEDFFSFFIHSLFHYIPFLWHFHKVHHSATVLNPITQYRIHPVELICNNITYLFAFGLIHGVFSWLFYDQAYMITSVGVNIFTVVFFFAGANLRHSHVRLTYFSWLENIFISPFQHQIHHSDHPDHFNKNMGSKLAIWDWLFGTLIKSKDVGKIYFGIGEENKDFSTFWKTLFIPFVKVFWMCFHYLKRRVRLFINLCGFVDKRD